MVSALGPAAKSAFPELATIALTSSDIWQRGDAINVLCSSDAGAMRLLAAGLNSRDRQVRLHALYALTCIRIAPDEVCLPALEGALDDPDPGVCAEAKKSVTFLNQQLRNVSIALSSPVPEIRAVGARLIGGYRRRALPFLFDLEAAAQDENPRVRAAVAEAIREVRGRSPSPAD